MLKTKKVHTCLGGDSFFKFSSLLGEDSHFDEHIFQMGGKNHQLVVIVCGEAFFLRKMRFSWCLNFLGETCFEQSVC